MVVLEKLKLDLQNIKLGVKTLVCDVVEVEFFGPFRFKRKK